MHLATSTNEDGFHLALQKTWAAHDLKITDTPTKSSLSEAREKVSYKFFEDIYKLDLEQKSVSNQTYRGFKLYAVDGDDLNLPASQSIIKDGYRGSLFAKGYETHYPKMYTLYAYDVLNGLVRNFSFSNKHKELASAISLIPSFEKSSIAIYDRLFCGYPLFAAHKKAENHYLVRTRMQGQRLAGPITDFLKSKSLDMEVEWYPHKKPGVDGIKVRLVKIKMPRTKQAVVLATSLPKNVFSREELGNLYKKRWEIETAFRDLTQTLKMNQWHSKKINGILQEVFALLWFVNNVKKQMTSLSRSFEPFCQNKYEKSNFKVCAKLVIENIKLVINRKISKLLELLVFWISRTKEKRIRYSRHYPRVLRGKNRKYTVKSKIKRRPAC